MTPRRRPASECMRMQHTQHECRLHSLLLFFGMAACISRDVDSSLVHLELSYNICTVLAFMCDCSACNTFAFCPEASDPPWSWCCVSACTCYSIHVARGATDTCCTSAWATTRLERLSMMMKVVHGLTGLDHTANRQTWMHAKVTIVQWPSAQDLMQACMMWTAICGHHAIYN